MTSINRLNFKRPMTLVLGAIIVAASLAAHGQAPIGSIVHADKWSGDVAIQGTVQGTYDNQYIVVRDDSGTIVCHIDERHWALGLKAGDLVNAKGDLPTDGFPQNHLKVQEIARAGEADPSVDGLHLVPISAVRGATKSGDLVFVVGEVAEMRSQFLLLRDKSATTNVDFGARYEQSGSRFNEGDRLLVVGEVKDDAAGRRTLMAIAIQPASMLSRADDPSTTMKVADALKAAPMATRVKVKGVLGYAFTAETGRVLLLQDAGQLLVIKPAARYASLIPHSGQECEVVGTYSVLMHEGKEHGLIEDARIDLGL